MLRKTGNILLWVLSGALLFGALGIIVFATPLFGNRMLIVRSGSMEPAISVGDVVIVRPDKNGAYLTNDVASFRMPGRTEAVVTHRITEIVEEGYKTKGDANAEADGWVVPKDDVLGRQLFVVPYVGKLLAFAKTRAGFASLVLVPALLVIAAEARVIWREVQKKIPKLERAVLPTPSAQPAPTPGEQLVSTSDVVTRVVHTEPIPVRKYVDGVSTRPAPRSFSVVGLAVILLMVSVMTPATFAVYTDMGTSSNNVFAAAEDFGGDEDSIADHIVISEVQIKGGPANNDFIELYNPTNSDISLTGWQITKRTASGSEESIAATILSGKTIAAHGFFLWANSQSGFNTSIGADVSSTDTLSENNSVALFDSSDVIVDQVAWGNEASGPQFVEGTAFTPSPDSGESIERKASSSSTAVSLASGGLEETAGNGQDANNNAADFVLQSPSNPENTSDTEP